MVFAVFRQAQVPARCAFKAAVLSSLTLMELAHKILWAGYLKSADKTSWACSRNVGVASLQSLASRQPNEQLAATYRRSITLTAFKGILRG